MDEKEKRIRSVTRLYYSNPKIQEALLKFSKGREVVPSYMMESFGKRPDILQYSKDINNLVEKGATSFHASEELWKDPLALNSELSQKDLAQLREAWDLVIDIDSPFLDYSKIATTLIIEMLKHHGIENYGIKFSGSKGFHMIIPSKAFPKSFEEQETRKMFPDWPRIICNYIMNYIRQDYNKKASEIFLNYNALESRTKLKRENLEEVRCLSCNKAAKKDEIVYFLCSDCGLEVRRKKVRFTKRKLRCLNDKCAGVLEIQDKKNYYYCENCKDPENENISLSSDKYPEKFESFKGVSAEKIASLDLVLVSNRHLIRMPYSLHEKTALASAVLSEEEIEKFSPNMANPLRVKIKDFLPNSKEGEANKLLGAALAWQKEKERIEEKIEKYKFGEFKEFRDIEIKNVTDDMFPKPIKKLLNGLEDGKKRGLFILVTFFKSLNFSNEEINKRIREWNKKNDPPLKEGYVKSQIEWHLKQKKKILPPNYNHPSFYKDLGLIESEMKEKNPLSEVIKKMKAKN